MPWPLLPVCGQKVASAANSALSVVGVQVQLEVLVAQVAARGCCADSNDTQELLARPARTIQVASPLSVAELDEVIDLR